MKAVKNSNLLMGKLKFKLMKENRHIMQHTQITLSPQIRYGSSKDIKNEAGRDSVPHYHVR